MYDKSYGSKYEEGLGITEIAKRVRGEIKAAIEAGDLPKGLKVSIRTRSYSGGRSLDPTVMEVPEGFKLFNPEYLRAEAEKRNTYVERINIYTSEAGAIAKKIEAIIAVYNYDGSDIMTDYFDVNFYGGHVSWDYRLEKADRERQEAELEGRPAPEAGPVEFGPEMVVKHLTETTHWTHWSASEVARALHVSVDRARKQLDALVAGCMLEADWSPRRRAKVYRLPTGKRTAEEIQEASARADEMAAEAKAQAKGTREVNKKAREEYAVRRAKEEAEWAERAAKAKAEREAKSRKITGADFNGPCFMAPYIAKC